MYTQWEVGCKKLLSNCCSEYSDSFSSLYRGRISRTAETIRNLREHFDNESHRRYNFPTLHPIRRGYQKAIQKRCGHERWDGNFFPRVQLGSHCTARIRQNRNMKEIHCFLFTWQELLQCKLSLCCNIHCVEKLMRGYSDSFSKLRKYTYIYATKRSHLCILCSAYGF